MPLLVDLGISVVLLLLGFGLPGWLLRRALGLHSNLTTAFALSVAMLYQIVVVFALTGAALARGSGAVALAVVCAALAIWSRLRPVAPVTAPLFWGPHHRERLARVPGSTAPTFCRVPE